MQETINIRPESSILAVLSHLNYKPWYALAEFVDNSIQSYLDHKRERTSPISKQDFSLRVVIRIDPDLGTISIRDNAGGIAWKDFPRAFKAAQLPMSRNGLNEFGLGMKTAACWFASRWTVRTSIYGEAIERSVVFDLRSIRENEAETLAVVSNSIKAESHFTEVTLELLNQGIPQKRTLGKIKEHLKDIYRSFIRSGRLELILESGSEQSEVLGYEERKFLTAPRFGSNNQPVGQELLHWRKDFAFEFAEGKRAVGFVGVLETGDTKKAGLSLFRRDRLIVGSDDETYRPEEIFGHQNDFTYQRLFGEIHLEGLQVAGTKDGFRWDGTEDQFLFLLKKELDSEPLPLIKQANNFRSRVTSRPTLPNLVKTLSVTSEDFFSGLAESGSEIARQSESVVDTSMETTQAHLGPATPLLSKQVEMEVSGEKWLVRVQYVTDDSSSSLIEPVPPTLGTNIVKLEYRLNLAHPFVESFLGPDHENLEVITFVTGALIVAEKTAQVSGAAHQASRMRKNFGDLLRSIVAGRGDK